MAGIVDPTFGGDSAGGGGSTTSTDPVIANATTLTAAEWEDVFDIDGSGNALTTIEAAGDGIHFEPAATSGRYGARLADALGVGDALIAFDFVMSRDVDIPDALEITCKVGIAPGGLDDPESSEWYAGGIDGISRDIYGSALTAWSDGAALSAWTNETKGATQTFAGDIFMRGAIERVGTDITVWLLRNNVRQQMETYAGAATTAGDVFIHIQSTSAGSHAVLLNLATSGLAWEGERLVSAA